MDCLSQIIVDLSVSSVHADVCFREGKECKEEQNLM